jgi:hypothetical protein
MSLSFATVTASIEALWNKGTGRLNIRPKLSKTTTFDAGTATIDQSNILYEGVISVDTTGSTLDLSGSLLDPSGATIAAAEITTIYIEKDDDDAGYLIIGGGSNALAGVAGFAEPVFQMVCKSGIPVTATTADLLKIAASAGTITANVVIVGRSVAV